MSSPVIPSETPLTAFGQQELAAQRANALQGWFAALGNRHYGRCNLVCMGDSTTEGTGLTQMEYRYPARLRDQLRALFPTVGLTGGGRGFLGTGTSGTISYTWPVTVTGGPLTSVTGSGPKSICYELMSGQSAAFSLVGDGADIMWVQYPGGPSFTWAVDGGTATDVSTNGTLTDGTITHVSLGAAGAHTLTITGTSATVPVYLDGVIEYNGDYGLGIQTHDASHYGFNTSSWINGIPASGWPAAVAVLKPNLIIIMIGTVDSNVLSAATYQTNLGILIGDIRGALTQPYPPIVLCYAASRAANTGTFLSPWADYVQAGYNVAAADPYALVTVLDMTLGPRMPAADATNSYGLWFDGIHFSAAGCELVADALAEFLTNT